MSYPSASSRAPFQFQHPDPIQLNKPIIDKLNAATYKVHVHFKPTVSLILYQIRIEPALDPVDCISTEQTTGQLIEKYHFTPFLLKQIPTFTSTSNPSPKKSLKFLTVPVLYQSNHFTQAYYVQSLFSRQNPSQPALYHKAYRKVAQTQTLTASLATILYSYYLPTYTFPIGPLTLEQTIDLAVQNELRIHSPELQAIVATQSLIPFLYIPPPPLPFHSILTKHGRASAIN
jgi:hypothetical protein